MSDKVRGLEEINRKLATLPAKIEKNILRSMVRAGAQVVRKEAIANLGGTGKDIILKPSRSKSRGKIVFDVGVVEKKWYLKFKEFGTKPHIIKINRKKVLSTGETVLGREVSHPGQPAQPFLRPALDENVDKVVEAMAAAGKKRIEKEASKG